MVTNRHTDRQTDYDNPRAHARQALVTIIRKVQAVTVETNGEDLIAHLSIMFTDISFATLWMFHGTNAQALCDVYSLRPPAFSV